MAMTVTNRGSGAVNLGATSYSAIVASNCTTGAMIVLCIEYDNAGTNGADPYSSISDVRGNTWTARVNQLRDPGRANEGCVLRIFTTPQNVAPLQTNDTVTVSFGSTTVGCKAYTLSEVVADTGYAPSYSAGTGATGASATPSVTTASITSGNVVIGSCGREYNGTRADDADTTNGSWSASQNAGAGTTDGGGEIITQSKVVTATGAQTYNPTFGGVSADYAIGWVEVGQVVAATHPGWYGSHGGWT